MGFSPVSHTQVGTSVANIWDGEMYNPRHIPAGAVWAHSSELDSDSWV